MKLRKVRRLTDRFFRRSSGTSHPSVARHAFRTAQTEPGEPAPLVCELCGKPLDAHDPDLMRQTTGQKTRVCRDCLNEFVSTSIRRGS